MNSTLHGKRRSFGLIAAVVAGLLMVVVAVVATRQLEPLAVGTGGMMASDPPGEPAASETPDDQLEENPSEDLSPAATASEEVLPRDVPLLNVDTADTQQIDSEPVSQEHVERLESAIEYASTLPRSSVEIVDAGIDQSTVESIQMNVLTFQGSMAETIQSLGGDCSECAETITVAGREAWVYQTGSLFFQVYFSVADDYMVIIEVVKDMADPSAARGDAFPVSVDEALTYAERVVQGYAGE